MGRARAPTPDPISPPWAMPEENPVNALRSGRLALTVLATAAGLHAQQFAALSSEQLYNTGSTQGIAVGDVDADGDRDLVLSSRLYLNDGTGHFTNVTATQLPGASNGRVELGDLDGDGDSDLAYAAGQLFANDGTGTFTDITAGRLPAGAGGEDVAIVDVDGDGDADLVFAVLSAQNTLYLNDGTGHFTDVTASALPVDNEASYAVAAGDLDGDGDDDLIFANSFGYNRFYENEGGTFGDATHERLTPLISDPLDVRDVAIGDLDGDGDPDLAFAACCLGGIGHANRLAFNDGRGFFSQRNVGGGIGRNGGDATQSVAIGDADGDGFNDLLYGNVFSAYCLWCPRGRANEIWRNDGTGNFTAWPQLPIEDRDTLAVALEDLDGDGDADAVIGNGGGYFGTGADEFYVNLQRQTHTPIRVRAGGPYQLDVYARGATAGPGDLAYLMLSSGTANLPTPFGSLFLDPTALVTLPPLSLPQPAGMASTHAERSQRAVDRRTASLRSSAGGAGDRRALHQLHDQRHPALIRGEGVGVERHAEAGFARSFSASEGWSRRRPVDLDAGVPYWPLPVGSDSASRRRQL